MPRPRKYEVQQLEAYSIYTQRKAAGEDVSAVDIQVDLEVKHPEGTASYRLITNWVKEFNNRDEWQTLLDSPFQWHLMDKYKLPWQAGDYLMDIFYRLEVSRSGMHGMPQRIKGFTVIPQPFSVREASWCWRVHLAGPEIGKDVGLSVDVACLASEFAFRESVRDVLGRPLEVADLEALLVYKPWLDFGREEHRHQGYHKAVGEGVVSPVKSTLDILLGIVGPNITEMPYEVAVTTHISGEHPELLMSQQHQLVKERGIKGEERNEAQR